MRTRVRAWCVCMCACGHMCMCVCMCVCVCMCLYVCDGGGDVENTSAELIVAQLCEAFVTVNTRLCVYSALFSIIPQANFCT